MQIMLAKALQKHPEISLTVVSLRDDIYGTTIDQQLESYGARVVYHSARKLWSPARFWRLLRFLRNEKFDVVHTHLPYANILGTVAGRLAGIPVIASIRSAKDDNWGRFYNQRQFLETLVLRHLTHKIMAVGHATAAAHQHRVRSKKIEPVPNALNIQTPLPSGQRERIRAELVGDPSRSLLISVGRLVEQKGYSVLLKAFASLHRKHPTAALLIAGDGPLKEELNAEIEVLKLQKHVWMLGTRFDIAQLLAASDIYISSSHYEGLSVAILEAMAAGLPVVATDVNDTPLVVVQGTGYIVPPNDPASMAASISSLLADTSLRHTFGAAARAFIQEKHNPSTWIEKILSLYEDVQGYSGRRRR